VIKKRMRETRRRWEDITYREREREGGRKEDTIKIKGLRDSSEK
jgi:hypothetical protein